MAGEPKLAGELLTRQATSNQAIGLQPNWRSAAEACSTCTLAEKWLLPAIPTAKAADSPEGGIDSIERDCSGGLVGHSAEESPSAEIHAIQLDAESFVESRLGSSISSRCPHRSPVRKKTTAIPNPEASVREREWISEGSGICWRKRGRVMLVTHPVRDLTRETYLARRKIV